MDGQVRTLQASEGHSQTGEHRQMHKSGNGKNPSEQGALTNWGVQTGRQIRTWKESK